MNKKRKKKKGNGKDETWKKRMNDFYNERERHNKEQQSGQVDNRTQPDPREQPKGIIYWFYYLLSAR